jgi:hypothetical protein
MKTENKEIEKKEVALKGGGSPAEMIRMAVSGGADLEKLEKLLALQERWEANEAKKSYHLAMSEFKENPPKIEKDKRVNFGSGKASYSHASLANVVEKITKELSKYGLSASWKTQQNGQIVVTCKITHVQGHSEETTLSAPSDTSGSKNAIQAIGSTITYLERYTLLAALGLATYDQDDDARAIEVDPIDEKQISAIRDYMMTVNADEGKFLAYLGVESLEKLPKAHYQKAIRALKTKAQGGKK